jgi:hypothetical protein
MREEGTSVIKLITSGTIFSVGLSTLLDGSFCGNAQLKPTSDINMKVPSTIKTTKASHGNKAKAVKSFETSQKIHYELVEVLGKNVALRFGPVGQPLNMKDSLRKSALLEAYVRLKLECEQNGIDKAFTDAQLVRVAKYKEFDVDKTVRLLQRMDERYWNITAQQIGDQLNTNTLFPLPRKLQSKDKTFSSFFYMKPSRCVPHNTPIIHRQ